MPFGKYRGLALQSLRRRAELSDEVGAVEGGGLTEGHVRYWTVDELGEFLGVPRSWIYDRTRENGPECIPHMKFGKYLRFNPESLAFKEWLDVHQVGGSVESHAQRRP